MRLDRRFVIVVGLSLLWAFVVSVVFYRAAQSAGKKRPWQAEKPLVVAVQALPMGAVIAPESVKLIRVPEKMFPKGGFSRTEEVLDRPVISPIQPEEPVVEARIALRGAGGGVAPLIPTGMRAVAVRVNDVVGVAGFVLPGMHVDVLVTGRAPGRDDTVTTTVLQNITVLSAGKTVQVDAKSQSISTPVVTLLVDPAQAESLTLANTEGRIQLVLRNSTDRLTEPTPGRELHELYALSRNGVPAAPSPPQRAAARASTRAVVTAALPPPRPPAPRPETVIMIRGNQRTEEPLEFHSPRRAEPRVSEPAADPEVLDPEKAEVPK